MVLIKHPMGAKYTMEAGGAAITLGYAAKLQKLQQKIQTKLTWV